MPPPDARSAGPSIEAPVEPIPDAVAGALRRAVDAPVPSAMSRRRAGGIDWAYRTWGDPGQPGLLLLHGVTSSSANWWRVGPALAARGFHVVAPDLPGHGLTQPWSGQDRFADTAADVAAFAGSIGLAGHGLRVIGHSWGALIAAALPSAGVRPQVLVLYDPPTLSGREIAAALDTPDERRHDDRAAAGQALRAANPEWADGDVRAKAEALTQFDERGVRDVLLHNDWDGGLAALSHPAAGEVDVWVVRGEPESGSYLRSPGLEALSARVGGGRVLAIAGGPHSPHRTHPDATVGALVRALGQP